MPQVCAARDHDQYDLAARTLDEFLLDELHRHVPCTLDRHVPDTLDGPVPCIIDRLETSEATSTCNVLAIEWKAFAQGASRRAKSKEVIPAHGLPLPPTLTLIPTLTPYP